MGFNTFSEFAVSKTMDMIVNKCTSLIDNYDALNEFKEKEEYETEQRLFILNVFNPFKEWIEHNQKAENNSTWGILLSNGSSLLSEKDKESFESTVISILKAKRPESEIDIVKKALSVYKTIK